MRPDTTEEAHRVVEQVSPEANPHQKQLFFDSLCAALTVDEVSQLARRSGLGDLMVKPSSDRHWTAERPATPR